MNHSRTENTREQKEFFKYPTAIKKKTGEGEVLWFWLQKQSRGRSKMKSGTDRPEDRRRWESPVLAEFLFPLEKTHPGVNANNDARHFHVWVSREKEVRVKRREDFFFFFVLIVNIQAKTHYSSVLFVAETEFEIGRSCFIAE